MPLDSTFSYSNAPQAIIPKKKYRSEDDNGFTLMSDPRVVRGVTRAGKGKRGATQGAKGPGKTRAQAEADEEAARSHQPTYEYKVAQLVRPEIDLSQFLVEREDTAAPKKPPKVAETQTDKFQERPDTPEYVPRKTGVDVHTQVEDVSELFVFDLEVEPMLSVICAKTLEQAMFELECEGELVNLQDECDRFAEIRVAEEQWVSGREQESIAASCTKDLALQALQQEAAAQRRVREKVAGVQAMQQMLPALLDNISDELFESGEWKRPEAEDIGGEFLPGVYAAAQGQLELFRNSQALVDEILLLAFEGRELSCFCCGEGGQHRAVIKLMCSGKLAGVEGSESVTLGFVSIEDTDSVNTIDQKVNAKLAEEGLLLGQEVSIHGFVAQALGHSQDGLSKSEVIDHTKLPGVLNIVLPDP
mmetsp:Transcript_36/g.67  ORF Transcript_36/g.67 Transcript_36/m.67 type:complete len:418 (-) Transcript_36:251-1504(-)|eukprot:CAMPEP_0114427718 /NCGR_PEP_ID=MMETSP0103-20121206/8515_1 /TAXON_ID=37642 ORGANISM="Paraphysomonas imperforata, Strain PA2" /NCGR_SAMPLE_ID=MMETSP0103 /ASSEMBLY_ACC=CAM_ASM_000201 /LENGTH=417 /DNA_ID=CAMNT_0001596833 /DNA_START=210 /DNA_END=1463 /DNA_ORIENTATION=-